MDRKQANFYAVEMTYIMSHLLESSKVEECFAKPETWQAIKSEMLFLGQVLVDYIGYEKYGNSPSRTLVDEECLKVFCEAAFDGEHQHEVAAYIDESMMFYGNLFSQYGVGEGIEKCSFKVLERKGLKIDIDYTSEEYMKFKFSCYLPTMISMVGGFRDILNTTNNETAHTYRAGRAAQGGGCLVAVASVMIPVSTMLLACLYL